MKREMAVVAASYFFVSLIQYIFTDEALPDKYYYLSCIASTTLVVIFCYQFATRALALYAILQVCTAVGYMFMLAGTENATLLHVGELLLWDYTYNLSLILFAFEIGIIAYGGLDACHAALRRLRINSRLSLHVI